jgi:hypothetical protein
MMRQQQQQQQPRSQQPRPNGDPYAHLPPKVQWTRCAFARWLQLMGHSRIPPCTKCVARCVCCPGRHVSGTASAALS